MKSGLEKKDFRIYFIVILGILLIVLFGNVKEGYFIDELYSYGLSNAEYKTDISDYDIYNTELKNSNESPFFKYMTVGENERFNYISVYKNQIRDVHPPLYYMILNTVCSLTPNVFNKWSGIGINLAIYIGIMLIFYTICKEVYQNKNLSLIACLVYTISAASIGMNIYIRMYSLLTFFTLLYLLLHIFMLKKEFNIKHLFLVGLVCFLGTITQYYFLITSFFISAIFVLILFSRHEFKLFLKYTITMMISLGCAYVFFPHMLTQLSGKNNNYTKVAFEGKNLFVKLLNNIISLISFINYSFFAGKIVWFIVFIIAVFLIFLITKRLELNFKIQETDKMVLSISLVAIFSSLTICIASWVSALRYYYNLFPMFVLITVYIIYRLLISLFSNRSYSLGITILVGYMFLAVLSMYYSLNKDFYKNNSKSSAYYEKTLPIPYLYLGEKEIIKQISKDKNSRAILITDYKNAAITQELYTLLNVGNSYICPKENISKALKDLDRSVDNFVIIDCGKGEWGSGYNVKEIADILSKNNISIDLEKNLLYEKDLNKCYVIKGIN